MSVELRINVN